MPGEIQNVPPQPIAFGKYTLLERISHGGMAEVFRAKTQGTAGFERIVAIKLLLPQVANDSDFVTMLIDEAKIAGQLSHANIAQIFDLGQVDGRYYIVQEYVPGRDLRAILHQLEDRHERLDVGLSCHIILKVCEALDYAHNKNDATGQPLNLVHRDISPQNVIVSHEGEVKLIDFGIVKAEGRATRTLAGLVKGKFAYMSPEQIRGLPVDRRADVFAAGIILHELLTGQPLFKRSSEFETLQRARSAEIEPPSRVNPAVPPGLDRVTLKALARHVDDRYQTAVALRDELWQFVRESGNFHSRDQLAAWMRDTFGEPNAADVEAAELSARGQPVPRRPAGQFEDEDGENMTVVDADLHSRLLLTVEDGDRAGGGDDVSLGDSDILRPDEIRIERPAPLRQLAAAAQAQPNRAVFRSDARTRRGDGAGVDLEFAAAAGEPVHEEEETTSARSDPDATGDPRSAWFEPQTPTRRRMPAAERGAGPFLDPDVGDPDDEVMPPPEDRRPHSVQARLRAQAAGAVEIPGAAPSPERGGTDAAATSPFNQVRQAQAEALLPPPPLGRPPSPPFGLPPGSTPSSPAASPDARTLGPGHAVPVPVRPSPAALPVPVRPPSPGAGGAGFPPYQQPSEHFPLPPRDFPAAFGKNLPEFGPPGGPAPPLVPDLIQTLPPTDQVQSPFRPTPGPPSGFPPPAGMGASPSFSSEVAPRPQLSSSVGRYLVVAAIVVLVGALTTSIVLAVTGS